MKKIIAYSLFGYGVADRLQFEAFLRNVTQVIRMNLLLYPDWVTRIHVDTDTLDSKYAPLFNELEDNDFCEIIPFSPQPLCLSMLQRIRGFWEHDKIYAIICRDLDSLSTYREVQAVEYWVRNYNKTMHAMTDSISHTEPLMGGMIGAIPRYFNEKFPEGFDKLVSLNRHDWKSKGSDQDFLRRVIYPRVTDDRRGYSITQHYLKGYGQTHYGDCFQNILDIELDLPEILKESNDLQVHIGQAGFNHDQAHIFFEKMSWAFHEFNDTHEALLAIEEKFSNIYYWAQ